MNKHLLFTRKYSPQKKIKDFIIRYNLICSYRSRMECIYESHMFMISISKYVTHIVLYDSNNIRLEYEIKRFFYGEKYEQFRNTRL